MTKKKAARRQVPNPTIPDVALELEGKRYRICFDFGALAIAKAKLREHGVEFNILRAIDFTALDVDTLPALFFAAAQKFQPDLEWKTAQAMVTIRTAESIAVGLFAAYKVAMLDQSKNPPQAPDTKA